MNPANGDIKAETLVSNFSENDIKARLAAAGSGMGRDRFFEVLADTLRATA